MNSLFGWYGEGRQYIGTLTDPSLNSHSKTTMFHLDALFKTLDSSDLMKTVAR